MWVKVSDTTCIKVLTKVGSQSMINAFANLATVEITPDEAALLTRRVMFVRHPLVRLASVFNHFYWLALDSMFCDQFIPNHTITAYGQRIKGNVGRNEWKHTRDRAAHYASVKAVTDTWSATPDQIATILDQKDWERFIDFVLSGKDSDEHWLPQVAQAKLNGTLIANIAHRFEDIATHWSTYAGGELPQSNSWVNVPKTDYRLAELQAYYADDIAFWEAINGTWNAN